jgi:Na+-translocating ferredoxin:NAD+ oxidoreductase subunit G
MAGNPEPSARRPLRAAIALAAAAIAAFGLVAVVHEATRDRIAATERARELARFDQVLGGVLYDNDLLADTLTLRDPELLGTTAAVTAYRARIHGQPVAIVLESVAPDGYSGVIRLLLAVAPDGTILGVRTVSHRETPGLGDFIDASKSDWIQRFTGKSLGRPAAASWRVRKDGGDFDQYTGATITSRAVVGAVGRTLELFARHRDKLLGDKLLGDKLPGDGSLAAPSTIQP